MPKFHEVLAVEPSKRNTAIAIIKEGVKTFSSKDTHFDGLGVVVEKLIEDPSYHVEDPTEPHVVTTVSEKLDYMESAIIEAMDVALTRDQTNQSAHCNAELVVDGINLGTFSATALMSLGTYLDKIHEVLGSLPTLNPSKNWVKIDDTDRALYKTPPEVRLRTRKRQTPVTVFEPTEHQPGQYVMETTDEHAARVITTQFSGKITPLEKSQLLRRLQKLIRATAAARAKANNCDAELVDVGKKVFEYIRGNAS